jgi:hypothetical protein
MAHDRTTPQDRLAVLGAHLSAHHLTVEPTARGLRVTNPQVAGCCAEVPAAGDLITCRPRRDDGGVIWYYTSWQEPIAPADRITDAAVALLGYLAERPKPAETAQ